MFKSMEINILLIDENKFDYFALRDFYKLKNSNYKILYANTTIDAKHYINQGVDIIVTDYFFNDGNLLDILNPILDSRIPFILLTGIINNEDALKVLKAGAFNYIIKDVKQRYYLDILYMSIENALSQKKESFTFLDQQNLLHNYQTILDYHENIEITDPNGSIIYANDNYLTLLGYSIDDIIGKPHSIMNSGYHSEEFFKDLWHTIKNNKAWKGIIRNKTKDGSYVWLDTTIMPFTDTKDHIYQYLSFRTDLTREFNIKEQLENTNHKLEITYSRETKLKNEVEKLKQNVREDSIINNIQEISNFTNILKYQLSIYLNSFEILEGLKKQCHNNVDLLINSILSSKIQILSLFEEFELILKNKQSNYNLEHLSIKQIIDSCLYFLKLDLNILYNKLMIKPFSDLDLKMNKDKLIQAIFLLLHLSLSRLKKDNDQKVILKINEQKSHIWIQIILQGININFQYKGVSDLFNDKKNHLLSFLISQNIILSHRGILLFTHHDNSTHFNITLPKNS